MESNNKTCVNTNLDSKIISSLSEYLDEIYKIKLSEKVNKGIQGKTCLIFRGQSSIQPLRPSVGRNKELYNNEKEIFFHFKRNYMRFYPFRLERNMDILMLGQHYGLPTRLLDWSLNPLVALYFAVSNNNQDKEKDGVVYIKNWLQYGNLKEGKEEDENKSIFNLNLNHVILMPDNFDIRFVNLDCVFEYFTNPQIETNENDITRIVIPGNKKKFLREQLADINYNLVFAVPTLDKLCENIKHTYITAN